LGKRTIVARFEPGVEAAACFKTGDEAVACSGTENEDGSGGGRMVSRVRALGGNEKL
jgi:hypothetical protein